MRKNSRLLDDPYRTVRPKPGGRLTPKDRPEFAPIDVVEIRERFELSQVQFARLIGISVETLRNWEHGRRLPLGPSRALLRIAAADPDLVAIVLRRERKNWTPEEDAGVQSMNILLEKARARRKRLRELEEEEKAEGNIDGPEPR